MDKKTLEELKSLLEKERDLLIGELKTIADPDPKAKDDWHARFPQFETSETNSSSDQEVQEDEVEEYESRLGQEHTLESRLLEVHKALERISTGSYGICKACRKEIPLERMRANPAAEYDVEHTPTS